MMRKHTSKRALLGTFCAAALALAAGAPGASAAPDPLLLFVPSPSSKPPIVPPTGDFNGPCGVALDSTGNLYVSDYYHHVIDVFKEESGQRIYTTQASNVDPLGGPCGLALDSSNRVYVNNYHRNVVKYNASPSFGTGTVFPLPAEDTVHHLPTGVAVDPETNNVYVDNRTYISVLDSIGAPVLDAGNPLKIGVGTLGDGYGVAVSQFPATQGRIYVPDAVSNTVKVYDPATSKVTPVAEIKDPFGKPFVSLRDSAVAVDRVTGDVYFADNTQPKYTERPQATIYIYGPTGSYKGHLKYNVVDALQPGIAVDNSATVNQGRVYVTSGNTNQGGVYVYGPGSGVFTTPLPSTFSLAVSTSGRGSVTSAVAKLDCEGACEAELLSGGELTLTATPDPGSTFSGWSGEGCSGDDPTCTLQMTEATSVSAHFAELPAAQSFATPQTTTPAERRARRNHRAKRRHKAKHRHRSAQRP